MMRSLERARASAGLLFATGPLASLTGEERAMLCDRHPVRDPALRGTTAAILARVERDGDLALHALARELDGVTLTTLEVPRERRREALAALAPPVRAAMERAIANLTAVHRAFQPVAQELTPEPGITIGRRPEPIARVGAYAPGGRGAYPSSVLMTVVPARVAGVHEIVLCTPPADDGLPAPATLAAAELAGADRVFAIGGAGAIAAMAFGTESVPRVDRIVGPGNAWVCEAKAQVAGRVAIDCPAGPSELVVVADASADAAAVAGELIAQAEHDPRACAVAVVVGAATAAALAEALARELADTPRREIVARSLASRGALLTADTLAAALAFAADYAPEHLMLAVADPERALATSRNAGTVFLGLSSSVAFGDYMTGANHVLPTGGLARSYSGLSPLDFVRWTTWQRVTAGAAASLAGPVGVLADAERLPAHARAARRGGTR
jgi:histidinol dehydrogenase